MAVLLLLLLAIPALTSAQGDVGCFVPGECTESFFTDIEEDSNPVDCLNFCKETHDCGYFTHYSDTSFCFALTNCAQFSNTTCSVCVSGEVACDLPCCLSGRCDGLLVSFLVTSSANECLDACKAETRCGYFSFDSSDGLCTLTRDCPHIDECPVCVYGKRECVDECTDPTLPTDATTVVTEPPLIGKKFFISIR